MRGDIMKNYKLNSNKLLVILLSGFILITNNGCTKKSENNYQQGVVENNYYDEVIHSKADNGSLENDLSQNSASNNTVEDNLKTDSTDNKESNMSEQDKYKEQKNIAVENSLSEEDNIVIGEITSIKDKVTSFLDSEEVDKFKDQAKGIFISLVDFFFYDGEVNGVKFDELTDSGKKKVLELANEIDGLIVKKFPDYKEDISEFTGDAYLKASELIKKGANNVKDFSKEKLGEENYNAIIDAKDELITYTKSAFTTIGSFSSKTWNFTKEKVKTWYEDFKNN